MDIRPLTPDYAVAPQIDPQDFAAIKAAGYTRVINNRPDAEIPPSHHASAMQAAAEAAGLEFVVNPVIGGALTMANVTAQAEAIATATGPVLAYCASGNRSSICWALAKAGDMPADDLIGIPARHGYSLEGLRPQIEALAKG
ncbi:TIGR01244 family phosphatase [Tabrizicola sp. WMC-M-20]|nr:TIGR01244 family phosphatase [Tabrizicola sp. WMC-M-20]